MKERPILFSAPMVRAILDGTKTQTRRVCKNKVYGNGFSFDGRELLCHNDHLPPDALLMDYRSAGHDYTTSNLEGWGEACPYGQPGDRLWVREAFAREYDYCDHPEMPGAPTEHFHLGWHYRADGNPVESNLEGFLSPWKPSIHMPRAASRITLEVTGVRVERLHDISEADAIAEGIWRTVSGHYSYGDEYNPSYATARDAFRGLWQSINGPESWDANPWVWGVEFKRVEGGAA